MKKVFISASRHWLDSSSSLAISLEHEGFSVCSGNNFELSNNWSGEILSAIKRCDIFVGVLDGYFSNVLLELGYALGTNKSVLLLRGCNAEVPFDIASLPIVNFDPNDNRSIHFVISRVSDIITKPRNISKSFCTSRELIKFAATDEYYLDELEPRELEYHIWNYFKELGLSVNDLNASPDRGFDLVISSNDGIPYTTVVIKKQNRNGRVSVNEVQRVVGAAVVARAECALILTTGSFTSSARHFAQDSPIPVILMTLEDLSTISSEHLREMIQKHKLQALF